MYNEDFLCLLKQLDDKYRACLTGFLDEFIKWNASNLYCILLFGGLVREKRAILDWSDIDLLIIYDSIDKRDRIINTKIKLAFENAYSVRFDISEIDIHELDTGFISVKYNSEYTNALAFRKDVTILVYGEIPEYQVDLNFEKQVAAFYINDTLMKYRKYLLENDFSTGESYELLPRIIRWVFSMIRASLRISDIYSHPYRDSILYLEHLYPTLNVEILWLLLQIRNAQNENYNFDIDDTINKINSFLSNYLVILNKGNAE